MPKKCKPKKPCCGFTLIELLVVIAIIAVLSTLAVVSLGSARAKANDAKRQADLRTLQTALEMYATDNGHFPTSATWSALGSDLKSYIGSLPQPPKTTGTDYYCYYTDTGGTKYTLLAGGIEKADVIPGDHDGTTIPALQAGYGVGPGVSCAADASCGGGEEKDDKMDIFCLVQQPVQ